MVFAILKRVRNRLVAGRGCVLPPGPKLPSEESARRVPSALNCPLRGDGDDGGYR